MGQSCADRVDFSGGDRPFPSLAAAGILNKTMPSLSFFVWRGTHYPKKT